MSKAEILFLNNKAMSELGASDMTAAIHDVERAYILTEEGDVISPGKCVMRWGSTPEDENTFGRINAMPGFIGGEYQMAGIKWIGSGPDNYKSGYPRASVTVILNDPTTKLPVCIADGTEVSAKRTGASGGVAMKLLSLPDSHTMTICGAGAQGRTQLEAASIVRPSVRTVYVYDINRENTKKFINEVSPLYPQITFIPAEIPEDGCRESDIIVCATLANEPFIRHQWLKKGCLLMNLADYEVTYDCVNKADKIIVDNWDTIKHRMVSTLALMWRDGLIKDSNIDGQLGQILTGKKTGRDDESQIIYFNAVGTGILDLAVVTRCYKKAVKTGAGIRLPYWE